jgi:beta-mannosidase
VLRITSLHGGWQFAAASWLAPTNRLGFSVLEWLPARVPGHVHLDLQEQGVIADPLSRKHELGVQWVDDEDWTYQTEFQYAPDPNLPRRVLRFQGLDTLARVFLNGEWIGDSDNMFLPLEIDVSERLRAGNNTLRVEFASAARVGRERRQVYFDREGLPADLECFDERAFVRKAQFMYGWDWGPRLVSVGIWRPVELLEYRARIVETHVEQRHLEDGSVELRVHSDTEGGGRPVHRLELGAFVVEFEDAEVVRLRDPRRWWPLGLGDPELYTLTSELRGKSPNDSTEVSLDRKRKRIGLRTIELVQKPDEFGTSFEFVVNGQPLWALGANWIPDHSLPSVVSRERLAAQLDRAKDMGMNMLRVWGGGLYESEDFYDLCDERGILVWQDFPFSCSYAPDDEQAQRAIATEATAQIKRLRHRASLALWCGNNENLTMFESKWGRKERHPPRYYGEKIWEGTLPELVAALDAGRSYVSSSPCGGSTANSDLAGDQHNWDVWHGRGDWRHYRDSRARFVSEFGFAAAPGRATWRKALGLRWDQDAIDPRHALARWHDKTMKAHETFVGYVELHYPKAKTLAEWSYTSQLNQRDAMRFALEHYRGRRFCRGTLIWQFNDCWPVQSWAVIDFEGGYKAAAFELRRLFAPAVCCVEMQGDRACLVVALDNVRVAREVLLDVQLSSAKDGTVLLRREYRLRLEPGERVEAASIDLSSVDENGTLLVTKIDGVGSTRLLGEPKNALLECVPLIASFRENALELESSVPLVDVFAFSDDEFSPRTNYLSLPQPGVLRFESECAPLGLRVRSLAGEHPVVWR